MSRSLYRICMHHVQGKGICLGAIYFQGMKFKSP